MLIKSSFLILFPFFCIAASIPLFLPPAEWDAAQPKGLSSHVRFGFVGKSSSNFHPSISLSLEKVDCGLKEYLKAVKEIHLSRSGTRWRDLGSLEMKAGTGRLTEISNADISILQAFYIDNGVAYILTAAVSKKDFLSKQKEILASFKTFELASDLWSALKEEKVRDKIFSLVDAKDWKALRQLIEKETSSMGKYWQYLALQEAYGKISSK